jgi:hypothetical protein
MQTSGRAIGESAEQQRSAALRAMGLGLLTEVALIALKSEVNASCHAPIVHRPSKQVAI